MSGFYPWAQPLGVSLQQIQELEASLQSDQDVLLELLEKNHINSQEYFNWARNFYALPVLHTEFFEKPCPADLWQTVQELFPWHKALLPLAKWDQTLFVGCVEPSRHLDLDRPIQFVLTSPQNLRAYWYALNPPLQTDSAPPSHLAEPQNTSPEVALAPAEKPEKTENAGENTESAAATETPESLPQLDFSDSALGLEAPNPAAEHEPTNTASTPTRSVDTTPQEPPAPPTLDPILEDTSEACTAQNPAAQSPAVDPGPELSFDFSSISQATDDSAVASTVEAQAPSPAEPSPEPERPLASITDINIDTDAVQATAPPKPPEAAEQLIDELAPKPSLNSVTEHLSQLLGTSPPPAEPATEDSTTQEPLHRELGDQESLGQKPLEQKPSEHEAPAHASQTDDFNFELQPESEHASEHRPEPEPTSQVLELVLPTTDKTPAHSLQGLARQALEQMDATHERKIFIHSDGGQYLATLWSADWALSSDEDPAPPPINVSDPNIFKIAHRSRQPFHGSIAKNDINDEFFATWSGGSYPEMISICPIVHKGQVTAFLVGVPRPDQDPSESLKKLEALSQSLATPLADLALNTPAA